MLKSLKSWFFSFFATTPPPPPFNSEQRHFLDTTVSFYRNLSADDKRRFESRCQAFIHDTEFIGHDLEVTNQDILLIAAGSVILAWGFEKWMYVRVETVILVSRSFNEHSEFDQGDSNITGLVGTHHLKGKMILSRSALHQGFSNDNDKRNVVLHEFAHLIDMADGKADGLPEQLGKQAFSLPWLNLISQKIKDINSNTSDIREYGATNYAEFFAVACEYFFENPERLQKKHPELYRALEGFFKQNRADIQQSAKISKKAPCPCGSGKRYKRCCLTNNA